jgi:hypothetical protein
LIEIDPAAVNIKLSELVLEVSTLVNFHQKDIFCLLNAASREQELYLVLRRDFHHLVYFRLYNVFTAGVVLSYHIDFVALEVNTSRGLELELFVRVDSFLKFVASRSIVNCG